MSDPRYVRTAIDKLPAWTTFLITAVPFGVAMGALIKNDGGSISFAAVSGGILGLAFGIAMTFTLRWQLYALGDVLGKDTSPTERRAAARALRRGPVPADPEVRAATIRLAEHQLEVLRRRRPVSLFIWPLLLISSVFGMLDGSLWRIPLVAVYLLLLGYHLYRPRKLRSRLEELTQGFEEDRS
jgi:hypothetical protein